MYNYKAKIINVVDGDTLDVDVDLGFHLVTRQRLRLARIDTEEMHDPDLGKRELALKAKLFTVAWIGKTVTIFTEKTDSFGRYLAEVVNAEGFNLSDELLRFGLAVEWLRLRLRRRLRLTFNFRLRFASTGVRVPGDTIRGLISGISAPRPAPNFNFSI